MSVIKITQHGLTLVTHQMRNVEVNRVSIELIENLLGPFYR